MSAKTTEGWSFRTISSNFQGIPMNLLSLFSQFYFSRLRGLLTARQFAITSLVLVALLWGLQSYGAAFAPFSGHLWLRPCGLGFALLILAMVLGRWFLAYPGTSMMLVANGRNVWSVHMAPLISIIPFAYARTPKGFLSTDTAVILRAAELCHFRGLIVLESHVLGAQDKREAAFQRLAGDFPAWDMWQGESREPLGVIYAWTVSRLRHALMKRHGKESSGLSPLAPVGLIVLRLRTCARSTQREGAERCRTLTLPASPKG